MLNSQYGEVGETGERRSGDTSLVCYPASRIFLSVNDLVKFMSSYLMENSYSSSSSSSTFSQQHACILESCSGCQRLQTYETLLL